MMADDPDPAERAALWAARRTDPAPLSAEESAAYTAWLAADPRHGRLLARLERGWRDPHLAAAGARFAGRGRRGRRAVIGLGAAAAASGALWLGEAPVRRALADRATSVGQVATFGLGTGTRATLDTASALVRDADEGWRLIEGAVRLDLDRGAGLVLSGGRVRVAAEGAVLVLHRRPAADRLAVLRGRAVADGVLVPPGQGASFGTGRPAAPAPLGPAERDAAEGFAEAWHSYEDAALAAVTAELGRYRLAPMWTSDAAGQLRVSGRFRFIDPDGVLAALEATLPIRVQQVGPLSRIFLR